MSWTTVGQVVVTGLANGAFYAFLALSFTVIFALTRALNLAHGELVLLGGYLGYTAGRAFGVPAVLLVPLAAIALVPLGLLWRALLSRVREPVELNSLVLTFGLSLVLQEGMLAAWSADYRLVPGGGGPPLPLGLSRERAGAAVLALVTIAGLQLLLSRTRLGAAIRATSRDAEAAALLGIDIDRVAIGSFAVAAAIAGAGGVLFGLVHYLHPAAGVDLTLLAITLAIFGGTVGGAGRAGPLGGLLLGGLLLGLTESVTVSWAGPRWRELVAAGLLLGVLLARPRGGAGGLSR
jgi:branched-chain amino acid transport system permease protein